MHSPLPLALALMVIAVLGGCAVEPHYPTSANTENLLKNASFEEGTAPWFSPVSPNWDGFSVTPQLALRGQHAVHLALHSKGSARSTKIAGVVQEVSPREFPRRLTGWYRVERWHPGTPKQYVQVVVIVAGHATARPFANYQIRYVLGGVGKPPLRILNARYAFVGPQQLRVREWIAFELDLHADFQRLWGHVPKDFNKIRVLFEARYDDRTPGEQPATADVFFDDLYLGQ